MRVRFFAAAKAAFGAPQTELEAATVGQLLALLPPSPVFERCSFLVDGVATTDHGASLAGAAQVDVLPPFSGG